MNYILANKSISHLITNCYTHIHHDLNFSDHLPLSVVLRVGQLAENTTTERSRVNWKKAIQDDLIPLYSREVSNAVLPLLSSTFQSVDDLNSEIISVCSILTNAASKHLPSLRPRKPSYPSHISMILNYDSCANKVGKFGRSGSLLAVHVKVNCMKTSVTQRKKSGSLSRLAEQDLNMRKSNLTISSSRRTTEIDSSRPLPCKGLKIEK